MNNGPDRIHPEPETLDPSQDGGEPTPLEQALLQALRPQEPPAGFSQRVLARAALERPQPPIATPLTRLGTTGAVVPFPRRTLWLGGAIAAALLLTLFGGESAWHQMREQRQRIANATAQYETTERVTVRALAQAREQLQRAGVPLTMD